MATGTGNALWNDAKETARSKFSEQQQAAASSLGDFAGALRKSAQEMETGRHRSAARFAQTAADGRSSFRERCATGIWRPVSSPCAFSRAAAPRRRRQHVRHFP